MKEIQTSKRWFLQTPESHALRLGSWNPFGELRNQATNSQHQLPGFPREAKSRKRRGPTTSRVSMAGICRSSASVAGASANPVRPRPVHFTARDPSSARTLAPPSRTSCCSTQTGGHGHNLHGHGHNLHGHTSKQQTPKSHALRFGTWNPFAELINQATNSQHRFFYSDRHGHHVVGGSSTQTRRHVYLMRV